MDENKGLSYFFLGLGIGVAVGMVFAPQAGAETRSQLRSRATEGGDYLRRRSEQFRDSAEDMLQRGKDIVGKQREQFGAAVEAGRQAYRDTMAPGGSSVPAANTNPVEGL